MRISILAVLTASLIAVGAQAADAPGEIKLGTLYASSGPFSDTSVPLHRGLKFWVDQKNEEGASMLNHSTRKFRSSWSPMTIRATRQPPLRSTGSSSLRTKSTS
jgi:hypothetical protein